MKRRSQPDHARLAAIVLAALTHEPLRRGVLAGLREGGEREPPGAERKPEACKRALAAARARRRRAARRRVARR